MTFLLRSFHYTQQWCCFAFQEEVNELAVHPKGEYLAAADDAGVVKVYSTRTRRLHKTLRNAHTVRVKILSVEIT